MVKRAGQGVRVGRELAGMLVELCELRGIDGVVLEPGRDALGKYIDVGEYLIQAKAGGRTHVLQGVANHDDPGPRIAVGAVEIDAGSLDTATDAVLSDDMRQFREAALE